MALRAVTFLLAAGTFGMPAFVYGLAQRTFDSPEAAAQALIDATSNNDAAALSALFGPNGNTILTSGDPQQDKTEREEFAQSAARKHQLEPSSLNSNVRILVVGDQDWPFPVPIVQSNGKWSFDTAQGVIEMRARKIGANELDAIEICSGYVAAQQAYAAQDRDNDGMLEYAQRIMSSPGKQDGLYWPGSAQSLVPQQFAEADVEGPGGTGSPAKPYHGYYFHVLKAQGPNTPEGQHSYMAKDSMIGGFALEAWPAQYGVTGIHTFIVNQDGVVYEKDLGRPANNLTPPVTQYDPDDSWIPVDD